MAIISPILRMRRAFRSMGVDAEQADEAAEAVTEHSYSRQESDSAFERLLASDEQNRMEFQKAMAEHRTQILLAILLATGLIIGAIAIAVAILSS